MDERECDPGVARVDERPLALNEDDVLLGRFVRAAVSSLAGAVKHSRPRGESPAVITRTGVPTGYCVRKAMRAAHGDSESPYHDAETQSKRYPAQLGGRENVAGR